MLPYGLVTPRSPGPRPRRSSRSAPGAGSPRSTWAPRRKRPEPSSSRSTTTAGPKRTSPAGNTMKQTWSTPTWARSTPWRTGDGRSPTPPSKVPWSEWWATPPRWRRAGGIRWLSVSLTAGTGRPRRGPTIEDGHHGSSSAVGWPSTTSSPTPPTVADRPMSSFAPPWPPASSPKMAHAGACASCAGWRRPPRRCGDQAAVQPIAPGSAQWGSARSSGAGRHSPRNRPAAGGVFESASAASTIAPNV